MKLAQRLQCRQLSILQYSLLPDAKYPTQLVQAAHSLRHTLKSFQTAQIGIGGDSADGNMVLGLLAHLKTAHPDIPPIDLPSSLASAICISPRCSNDTTSQSFVDNAGRDVIDASSLSTFAQSWQPVEDHVWAAANHGCKAFWSGENSIKADKMLIVAGKNEVYLDDRREFSALVPAESPDDQNAARQFVIAPDSVHVQAVIDHAMGAENGAMTKALLDWAGKNTIAPLPDH